MNTTCWILALWCTLATTVSALELVSTSPAHGAAGVGTTTQLILQFDSPLDPGAVYDGDLGSLPVQFLLAEPWDAIVLESYDFVNGNTALALQLSLEPDTDYTFVLSAATGADASGLAEPVLWFFSTAVELGTRQVGGAVEFSGVAANALVVLMNGPLSGEEPRFMSGCLAGSTGQFQFPWVRSGLYYPVAALDLDGDGMIDPSGGVDRLGFYDPDGDGQQDAIQVDEQDLTGITISLDVEFAPRTAREAASAAAPIAFEWNPDSELKAIMAWEAPDSSGAVFSWMCLFGVSGVDELLAVVVNPFGTESFSMPDEEGVADQPSVPENFLDSDQVAQVALAHAGLAFLEEHSYQVEHLLMGGAQSVVWPQDPQRRLWTYEFLFDDGENQDFLLVMMDMVTGEVLNSTTVEPGPAVPQGLELAHNAPNPFNPDTILRFHLPSPGRVRLVVYDILGREVAVVLKGAFTAGEHRVRFDGSALAGGLYFYTLEYEGARLTRSMTLLK